MIPLHIKPTDRSLEAETARLMLTQRMAALNPKGFRRHTVLHVARDKQTVPVGDGGHYTVPPQIVEQTVFTRVINLAFRVKVARGRRFMTRMGA